MEILRFTLGGKNAFFKKPEVNSYCYFTYGNIHKVALLGIFGAILGYKGYTQQMGYEKKKKQIMLREGYPEFYEKLKDLKISILPKKEYHKGYIPKKIQTYNNSVGYASKEQGGNLIVKEQWLENPKWEICVLIDSKEAEKVKNAILEKKCVYYPYLGKNDHPADITEVSIEEAVPVDSDLVRLACLCMEDLAEEAEVDLDDLEEMDSFPSFRYQEALPWKLEPWANQYILKRFIYTDYFFKRKNTEIYQLNDGKQILFY